MKYTRAPAISEPHAGGKYSVFEGSVSGEYIEVTDVREQRGTYTSTPLVDVVGSAERSGIEMENAVVGRRRYQQRTNHFNT
jgi:hypothetical protein